MAELSSMDIRDLLAILPHRFPMLLVDRILELDIEGGRCRGLKNVTINEPFFPGHYPGMPIMPGVLIIEAMAQTGAALLLRAPELTGKTPLIGAIDDVKFKRPVVPGDQLIIDVEVMWVKVKLGIGRIKATATVEGEVAASMEMTFKVVDREALA